jgi:hypothetical protein
MRKLDDAKKRKKFPLWLSEGERLLLEAKAEEYQYKYLADYIRDAAIYESLIKVNLTGSENLISCYQKYISEIKKYTKEVRRILRYGTTLSAEEKELLQNSLFAVYSQLKSLKGSTEEKLDYEVIEEIAKNRIEDKYYKN